MRTTKSTGIDASERQIQMHIMEDRIIYRRPSRRCIIQDKIDIFPVFAEDIQA